MTVVAWLAYQPTPPAEGVRSTAPKAVSPGQEASPQSPSTPVVAPAPGAPAPFALRPFAAAQSTSSAEWTSEDGKDPGVIRRLAHNDLEYARMIEENSRIHRRQLVYRKQTAAALIQEARLTGQPVRQLILPGLDGQEVQFEIANADLKPSGMQGSFSGIVAGRPDSMVTLAFMGGREAFTVLSPTDNLYLQGDPREPGEVIVKSIDPATYVVGVCGNP